MRGAVPTDAFVLRVVDYRDADRVVTLLTRDRGKVSAIARGARRSRRRFAGSLEPHALVEAEVAPGRGELDRLASARVTRAFPSILADLTKMTYAGVAMQLVRELVPPHEPDERVFETVVRLHELLDGPAAAREQDLLSFELRMLAVAGFAPSLDRCAVCGRSARQGQAAMLDPVRGSVVCRACGGGPVRLSGQAREAIARASGSGWDAVHAPWAAAALSEVRTAARGLCEHRVGKALSSGPLVAQIRELPRG